MNSSSQDHALTSDQEHLVDLITGTQHQRLLVVGPPGTGKSYTVPIAIDRLKERVPDLRVLVLAPAALARFHVAMLRDRLSDPTALVHIAGKSDRRILGRSMGNLWEPGIYVMSLDLAKQHDIAESVASSDWDLVVVDEAHTVSAARADLVVRLAGLDTVRAVVLLSASAAHDRRVSDRFTTLRWRRLDEGERSARVRAVIAYERTDAERRLYARLFSLLDTQAKDATVRDRFERAWRSSAIALEKVVLRERTTLQIAGRKGSSYSVAQSLSDPLVLSESSYTDLESGATAWFDPMAAASEMDGLLDDISSLPVDSKFEALLSAIGHEQPARARTPCVVTAMRESAIYIAQALESHQLTTELVDGKLSLAFEDQSAVEDSVVVATDLGLKGIELDSDVIVCYELLGSRLRMEYRWSRIDRLGGGPQVTMIALQDVTATDPVESELLTRHGFVADSSTM